MIARLLLLTLSIHFASAANRPLSAAMNKKLISKRGYRRKFCKFTMAECTEQIYRNYGKNAHQLDSSDDDHPTKSTVLSTK